jgi:hypothetical protein
MDGLRSQMCDRGPGIARRYVKGGREQELAPRTFPSGDRHNYRAPTRGLPITDDRAAIGRNRVGVGHGPRYSPRAPWGELSLSAVFRGPAPSTR